jgi:hypothetical protein
MPLDDHHAERKRLLDELDHLDEEKRSIDTRDPNAFAEWQRKLQDLRRRIEAVTRSNGAAAAPKERRD